MTKISVLHRRLRKDADYKAAYDALGEEFHLARALIEARAAAGLSQSQLAKKMKTSQSTSRVLKVARYDPPPMRWSASSSDPHATSDHLRAAGFALATTISDHAHPESRIMHHKPDGFVQGYNVQVAVEGTLQLIVGEAVTQETNDKRQLRPMIRTIQQQARQTPAQLLADTGYCSDESLRDLAALPIDGYIATRRLKHSERPAPAPRGRIPRDATALARMARKLRTRAGAAIYATRKHIVEAKDRTAEQQRRVRAIELKLDGLDEAFLFAKSIDETSYGRQRDKLREELYSRRWITMPTPSRNSTWGDSGVRRTHSAARLRPVGAGFARLQATSAAAVLPRGHGVRRNSVQSNRRNRTAFQVFVAGRRRSGKCGEPDWNRTGHGGGTAHLRITPV